MFFVLTAKTVDKNYDFLYNSIANSEIATKNSQEVLNMAVPKHKVSKQAGNSRYANWKIEAPAVGECPQCHSPKLSHRACKACGYYDKNRSVEVKQDKE